MPRADFDVEAALDVVRPICDAVRHRGVEAITEFPRGSTGVEQTDIAVPRRGARPRRSPRSTPTSAPASRSRSAGCAPPARPSWSRTSTTQVVPGGTVSQMMVPVQRVGLYVPGGIAPLVSSVVMNVVPAQVAGVESIALTSLAAGASSAGCRTRRSWRPARCSASTRCTPSAAPRRSRCSPTAPARAARSTWSPGPGNIYTVAAKRLLKGVVGIDSEAGPTEIAILADDTADPAFVAADLISQAEHDPMAAAVLVTDSPALADDVEAELDKQVSATRHVERIRTALAGEQSGIVLVDDLEQGLAVVDAYAAEHLEIQTRDAAALAPPGAQRRRDLRRPVRAGVARRLLRRAPTTCCRPAAAPATPPGCRCARSCKAVHVVEYDERALRDVAPHVVRARRRRGPARSRRRRRRARRGAAGAA